MSGSSGVCRRMDGTLLAEVVFDVVVMHHGHAADGTGRGCTGAEATRQCSTRQANTLSPVGAPPYARCAVVVSLNTDLYRETQRRLDGAGRGRGGTFWG